MSASIVFNLLALFISLAALATPVSVARKQLRVAAQKRFAAIKVRS
jgi:hypothetical protein